MISDRGCEYMPLAPIDKLHNKGTQEPTSSRISAHQMRGTYVRKINLPLTY